MRKHTKQTYKDLKTRTKTNVVQIVMYTLVATYCCLAVFLDFHRSRIKGQSMFPALRNGGMILEITAKNIERGDIITARYNSTIMIVKRVVGLPGENLKLVGNNIYINDHLIFEYYITNSPSYETMEFQIGEDEVFIMGDNRDISEDSRYFGPVKLSRVHGKVIWNYQW